MGVARLVAQGFPGARQRNAAAMIKIIEVHDAAPCR
jgi:hypothetical protein